MTRPLRRMPGGLRRKRTAGEETGRLAGGRATVRRVATLAAGADIAVVYEDAGAATVPGCRRGAGGRAVPGRRLMAAGEGVAVPVARTALLAGLPARPGRPSLANQPRWRGRRPRRAGRAR